MSEFVVLKGVFCFLTVIGTKFASVTHTRYVKMLVYSNRPPGSPADTAM